MSHWLIFQPVLVGDRAERREVVNLPDTKGYRQLALATTIPIMMLAAPAVGYFIGRYLDRVFDTSEVMTVIFLLLGVVAGGVESYNLIKRIAKVDNEK